MKKIILLYILLLFTNIVVFSQEFLVLTDSTQTPEVDLGEIVVSASRTATLMKDMPTSITLIKAKQVENNNIQSLEDINLFAPNFFMVNYGTKLTSPVYIRGIGSKKNSPAVGLYVDGVPYFEIASMNFDFFDISKLEILRGPQGTLFGRNTMGGLININTLSPLNYQGVNVRLSAANYGMYNATMGYYDKIANNKFAYSLTANYRHNNGFFKNNYDNSMADKLQSYGIRNRLAYSISNNFLIENILSFEHSQQSGYPYKKISKTDNVLSDVNYNETSGYNRFMLNNGLKIKYDAKPFEINTTLAYQTIDDKQSIDQDFTDKSLYFVEQKGLQNMFSGEGIIRSKGNDTYNWLFGVFAFSQFKDKTVDVYFRKYSVLSSKNYEQQIASSGIFHQSELKLFDKLTITAGLRYNYEQSVLNYKYKKYKSEKLIAPTTDTVYPNLKEHIFLPKISVSYAIGNASLYLLYASGYKPGGFNSTFERKQDLQFEKQMSYNYEIGYKQSFFKGKIYADLSLFWSNIQGQQIARSVPSGRGTYLENAGKSQNKGVEVSVQMSKIAGFEFNVAYGYTQSVIQKYEKNDSVNYNGNTAPYVPLHTLNTSVAKTFYTKNIKYIKGVCLQVDYQRLGHIYWRIENDFEQKSYGMLNARISLITSKLNVDFWAKNITNTSYNAFMLSSLGNTFYQQGVPRLFGVTVSAKIHKR